MLWQVRDGIGQLTFNRPEHANALGLCSRADMEEAFAAMAAAEVSVVLLSAHGKFFCADGDIGDFIANIANPVSLVDELIDYLSRLLRQLASLPVPVISVINGPVSGAGIGFALCADFVLASDAAKLRGGYCALGLTPDLGSSYFLTRRVGAARAKEIFMLNRALSAQACLDLGIVDHVYPAAQLNEAAITLARELANGPTAAYARVKALCNQAASHDLYTHLDAEHVLMLQSARSADFQEGLAAFAGQRAPHFAGR